MPYWLLIIVGVSLLGSLLLSIYNKNWNYMFLFIPFFILQIFISGSPFIGMTADNLHYTEQYKEDTVIYSLRTYDAIEGRFVLGNGSLENITYYIYYTQANDGAYSINRVETDKCKIYMDRESGGVLTRVWGKIDDANLSTHWGWQETIFSHYELHLPYGSLIQEYSVR